ncbi:MAG: MvaI/BcnI family restriction endonuclease [bacterium]|nr:MvaI/BcnI family restriction endonuclease [bacterium]
MDELIKQFYIISNKKWIKGINNLTNSVGLTFESLLNKCQDSLFFPDYFGIEIKCTQRFSHYPITLFSCSFDGKYLYQMNELLIKYGTQDLIYKERKILISKLSYQNKTLVNGKYFFKIDIDEEKERLYLSIYDLNNNLLDKNAYINFSTLKNKLELKLSKLAVVWASKKKINNQLYFRYYKMIIYKLTSFDNFINLIKKDIIIINIIGRISRSGIEAGRQRNKNLVFQISKDNIIKLFEPLKIIDTDLDSNFQIL